MDSDQAAKRCAVMWRKLGGMYEKIAYTQAERGERVAAEAAAQAKRDKDRNHRTACKKEAMEALVGLGLSEADAVKVVLALIGGEVPHSTWSF